MNLYLVQQPIEDPETGAGAFRLVIADHVEIKKGNAEFTNIVDGVAKFAAFFRDITSVQAFDLS